MVTTVRSDSLRRLQPQKEMPQEDLRVITGQARGKQFGRGTFPRKACVPWGWAFAGGPDNYQGRGVCRPRNKGTLPRLPRAHYEAPHEAQRYITGQYNTYQYE